MARPKSTTMEAFIERMQDEASWLLSHAQALADYGRPDEAAGELARAAVCEDQVACLLRAAGQPREAAIHWVSAASCYDKIGQAVRAIPLLCAALSADLTDEFRDLVEQLLARCLAQARKDLRRAFPRGPRRPSSRVS